MRNVYTVAQVNSYIKNMFSQDFMLQNIYVKGEVSNCKYHSSGHIYFTIKDARGTIACVMFAGNRSGLKFRMEEGQQVVVGGSVEVYERDGKYQLYAREIILDGAGYLYEKFERLKKELAQRGLFAPEYKQPVPKYIRTLGVVTAPTGAAVQDIINITRRRNPYVRIILYPAIVQGEQAAASIIQGIHALEQLGVDVMIVGRGGGSIEDLWAFNEEEVARAIFECSVPVISAVGHETDTTIADYAADLRAPTPSAAAELAVYDYRQVQMGMQEYRLRMNRLLNQKIQVARLKLREYHTRLKYLHPRLKLQEQQQRLSEMEDRMKMLMEGKVRDARHRMALYVEVMKGLSPLQKLSHGYAYVEGRDKKAIKSIRQVRNQDRLSIYVTDGILQATVEDVKEEQHG